MLYSVSEASKIVGDMIKKPLYFRFMALHTINESAANTMNLPTSLVERRKQRASVFLRLYHDFPRYDWLWLGKNNLN
jgi:hypothetical protein